MTGLPLDVWAMMIFTIIAFFGVSIFTLVYTLRQEEQKMDILKTEKRLDTLSPQALRDLRAWIQAHPDDPDVERARERYRECVEALESTDRHFYNWSADDIAHLEPV